MEGAGLVVDAVCLNNFLSLVFVSEMPVHRSPKNIHFASEPVYLNYSPDDKATDVTTIELKSTGANLLSFIHDEEASLTPELENTANFLFAVCCRGCLQQKTPDLDTVESSGQLSIANVQLLENSGPIDYATQQKNLKVHIHQNKTDQTTLYESQSYTKFGDQPRDLQETQRKTKWRGTQSSHKPQKPESTTEISLKPDIVFI